MKMDQNLAPETTERMRMDGLENIRAVIETEWLIRSESALALPLCRIDPVGCCSSAWPSQHWRSMRTLEGTLTVEFSPFCCWKREPHRTDRD